MTLFASGDSVTDAKLVLCSDVALRLNPAVKDPLPQPEEAVSGRDQLKMRPHHPCNDATAFKAQAPAADQRVG